LAQLVVDHRVVEPVAGEAVDLVDDAVGDRVGLHVGKEALEGGPVGAGADSPGSMNSSMMTALRLGLALVGLPLRGKREPLVAATPLGLLLGRDPQMGDGQGTVVGHRLTVGTGSAALRHLAFLAVLAS